MDAKRPFRKKFRRLELPNPNDESKDPRIDILQEVFQHIDLMPKLWQYIDYLERSYYNFLYFTDDFDEIKYSEINGVCRIFEEKFRFDLPEKVSKCSFYQINSKESKEKKFASNAYILTENNFYFYDHSQEKMICLEMTKKNFKILTERFSDTRTIELLSEKELEEIQKLTESNIAHFSFEQLAEIVNFLPMIRSNFEDIYKCYGSQSNQSISAEMQTFRSLIKAALKKEEIAAAICLPSRRAKWWTEYARTYPEAHGFALNQMSFHFSSQFKKVIEEKKLTIPVAFGSLKMFYPSFLLDRVKDLQGRIGIIELNSKGTSQYCIYFIKKCSSFYLAEDQKIEDWHKKYPGLKFFYSRNQTLWYMDEQGPLCSVRATVSPAQWQAATNNPSLFPSKKSKKMLSLSLQQLASIMVLVDFTATIPFCRIERLDIQKKIIPGLSDPLTELNEYKKYFEENFHSLLITPDIKLYQYIEKIFMNVGFFENPKEEIFSAEKFPSSCFYRTPNHLYFYNKWENRLEELPTQQQIEAEMRKIRLPREDKPENLTEEQFEQQKGDKLKQLKLEKAEQIKPDLMKRLALLVPPLNPFSLTKDELEKVIFATNYSPDEVLKEIIRPGKAPANDRLPARGGLFSSSSPRNKASSMSSSSPRLG